MNFDKSVENLINELMNINIYEMANHNPVQPINVAFVKLYMDMIQPYNDSPNNHTQYISSSVF